MVWTDPQLLREIPCRVQLHLTRRPRPSAEEQSVLSKQDGLITFGKEALKVTHKVNQGQALRELGSGEDPPPKKNHGCGTLTS